MPHPRTPLCAVHQHRTYTHTHTSAHAENGSALTPRELRVPLRQRRRPTASTRPIHRRCGGQKRLHIPNAAWMHRSAEASAATSSLDPPPPAPPPVRARKRAGPGRAGPGSDEGLGAGAGGELRRLGARPGVHLPLNFGTTVVIDNIKTGCIIVNHDGSTTGCILQISPGVHLPLNFGAAFIAHDFKTGDMTSSIVMIQDMFLRRRRASGAPLVLGASSSWTASVH
jgi:hypothetical protein